MEYIGYKHFIITRFNLEVAAWKHDKSGNKTHTEEWLQKRFELFDLFCFPSIANQSNTAFKWLVLFSNNTPDFFKEKIKEYEAACSNFVAVYMENGDNLLARVSAEISNLLTGEESYLITTRIDNDDAFHKDMTGLIQLQFNDQEDMYLNFNNGLQYDIDNHVLCKCIYKNNAFISRIEKINNNVFKTVYEKNHDISYEPGMIRYINIHPVWLQTIHGGNITNSLRIKGLSFSITSLKGFNIKYAIKISFINSVKLARKYLINKLLKISKIK